MKTSCRTMMVGLIGLWLGGCSVVVFEDSAACPAQKTCPIDTIKVAPVPEGTELNALEQILPKIACQQMKQLHLHLDKTE